MQLVARRRQVGASDERAVVRRLGIGVDDAERVLLAVLAVAQQRDVRERLRRRLDRHAG